MLLSFLLTIIIFKVRLKNYESIIFIKPPVFFFMSANNKTPSAPILQKIFPFVNFITSLSKRFFPVRSLNQIRSLFYIISTVPLDKHLLTLSNTFFLIFLICLYPGFLFFSFDLNPNNLETSSSSKCFMNNPS